MTPANDSLRSKKITRHILGAAFELFLASFVGLFAIMLPFNTLLFRGASGHMRMIVCCFCAALATLVVPLMSVRDLRTFDWYLIGAALVKRRKKSLNDDVTRVELNDVLRFRFYRELPLIGGAWYLRLSMKEVLSEPPVLIRFLGVRITGRKGMHRTHHISYLTHQDKDMLLDAITKAQGAVMEERSNNRHDSANS